MKFRFPFQNVLKHRKILEDLAQRDFQEALHVLNQEIEKLNQMKMQVDQARTEAFQRQTTGGLATPGLRQIDEFLRGQDIRIERQQAKIQELEKKVEDLREILRVKAVDYKIIESLRDKKKTEFNLKQRKLEQKLADEMNTMRFRSEEQKK